MLLHTIYNTVHYSMVWDITRFNNGCQTFYIQTEVCRLYRKVVANSHFSINPIHFAKTFLFLHFCLATWMLFFLQTFRSYLGPHQKMFLTSCHAHSKDSVRNSELSAIMSLFFFLQRSWRHWLVYRCCDREPNLGPRLLGRRAPASLPNSLRLSSMATDSGTRRLNSPVMVSV